MANWLYYYQHIPEHIDPVAFKIGIFSIDWYSLGYLVGFIVVYCLLKYRLARGEFPENFKFQISNFKFFITDFMPYAIVGLLIGGRLGYVLFYNLPYYLAHPLEIVLPFQISNFKFQITGIYGMSYHGGLIGVILASLLFVHFRGSTFKGSTLECSLKSPRLNLDAASRSNLFDNFWQLADFVVPAVPAGYFFGRIGNFFNGELYGRATTVFLGMYFPSDPFGLLRHPSQLYEAFFEGLVLFVILWSLRNFWTPGVQQKESLFLLYLFLYGFFRFFIEFFRAPDEQIGLISNYFSLGQIFSILMMLAAILIFWQKRKKVVQ